MMWHFDSFLSLDDPPLFSLLNSILNEWKRLANSQGQMAIFVALIFQVLFVFFAMAINVALVVHDKINLQNATDLAAYYGAQKQAEMLNIMAHKNYQIRQSWKLLTWRYRVLGGLGLQRPPHPATVGGPLEDQASFGHPPSICITYKPWAEVQGQDNLCKEPETVIPPLPRVPIIAGFNGINAQIHAFATALRRRVSQNCDSHGAFNYWFAATILKAFREDQKNRKDIMYALADNLSQKNFRDLNGHPVVTGVQSTFLKNLTYGNSEGQPHLEFFNSLEGRARKEWLSEIRISPTLLYIDNAPGEGCRGHHQSVVYLPQRPGSLSLLDLQLDPPPHHLRQFAMDSTTFGPDNNYAYSLGVEKNPWIWAYVGIKAETTPRPLFFPIGPHVRMVARSFAKPFGGRMGPWFQENWPEGASQSQGERTDPLLPPRNNTDGSVPNPEDRTRLPNYSRFPGDLLGLQSSLALAGLQGMNRSNLGGLRLSYGAYGPIAENFEHAASNDILPWDSQSNQAPPIRRYELAAIAPDLFDITYYSIEPNFNSNYLPKLRANRGPLRIPTSITIRGDLGTRKPENTNSVSVQSQILSGVGLQRPEAFYFVRDKTHLLTSWLPNKEDYRYDAFSQGQPVTDFGRCRQPDDTLNLKVPGSCVAGGGRTGYSVKFISRDALLNGRFPIGGPNIVGPIANPPPEDEGW